MTHAKILKLAQKFSQKLSLGEEQGAFKSQTEMMDEFVMEFHSKLLSCISALGGELYSFTQIRDHMGKNADKKQYMFVKAIAELMKDLYIDLRNIMRTASDKEAYGGVQRFIEYMTSRSTIAKLENIDFFVKNALKQKVIVISVDQLKDLLSHVERFIEQNPVLAPPEYANNFHEARLNSDNVTGVQPMPRLYEDNVTGIHEKY